MNGLSLLAVTSMTLMSATPYNQAREASLESGQPLVVLVGADWCPHCRTMKTGVIPELKRDGILSQVAFVSVNSDRQQKLAGKLMRGSGIPQLVMYAKTPAGWQRTRLVGGQNAGVVKRFLQSGIAVAEKARRVAQRQQAPQPKTPDENATAQNEASQDEATSSE